MRTISASAAGVVTVPCRVYDCLHELRVRLVCVKKPPLSVFRYKPKFLGKLRVVCGGRRERLSLIARKEGSFRKPVNIMSSSVECEMRGAIAAAVAQQYSCSGMCVSSFILLIEQCSTETIQGLSK